MTTKSLSKDKKYFLALFITILVSYALFQSAGLFQEQFSKVMSITTYLSWHNMFEFAGILISFSVYIVPYYTYYQGGRLKSIFLGNIFLISGILDVFHTLTFKGMPEFFGENITANRATTFWIISRLIWSAGLFIYCFVSAYSKRRVNRNLLLGISITFCIGVLYVLSSFPGFIPSMYIEGFGLTPLKVYLEYLVITFMSLTIILLLVKSRKEKDSVMVLLSIAVALNIFTELAFVTYNSVYDIYNYLGHIYKIIAFFIIFKIQYVYNIQQPYYDLVDARNEIKNYADHLDLLVEKRTAELDRINRKLLNDLEFAMDIQKAMLPENLPNNSEVVFDARYFPAERVSGDSYNIFKLDEQNIGMYIGDVSGHGVSAAMLTVFLNQSVKTVREAKGDVFEIMKPSEVLRNLYEAYNKLNLKDDIYLVLIYGIYDIKTKELTYSSAGMNTQPVIIKHDGKVQELDIKGFPICKLKDIFPAHYMDSKVQLDSGDKILLYTDGLIEAKDTRNERYFSKERLLGLLSDNFKLSCPALSEVIIEDIYGFTNMKHLNDDITFFIMQIN